MSWDATDEDTWERWENQRLESRTGNLRNQCSKLLGRLDAGIRVPECAPSLEDVREALEAILTLAREVDEATWRKGL